MPRKKAEPKVTNKLKPSPKPVGNFPKKVTDPLKDTALNIRINRQLLNDLHAKAEKKKDNTSHLIRDWIQDYVKGR